MSDTPETDEQTFAFAVAQKNDPPPDYKLVRAGFAQKLERERDEARREAEEFREDMRIHITEGPATFSWEPTDEP